MNVIRMFLLLVVVSRGCADLRCELQQEWLDHASWRNRLVIQDHSANSAWRILVRRERGECGTTPHLAAFYTGKREPWSLHLGRLSLRDRAGVLVGNASQMGGMPAPLGELLRVRGGSASSWQAEITGAVLCRTRGVWRGGLASGWTARDRSAAGDGFVLGMSHDREHAERRGAWREGLLLGWLTRSLLAGVEAQSAFGLRRDPAGRRWLCEFSLQHQSPYSRMELGWGQGEHRLLWWMGDWRVNRLLQLQGACWQGRRSRSHTASPVFALPTTGKASGILYGLKLKLPHLRLECSERVLRGSSYDDGNQFKQQLRLRLLPTGRVSDPVQARCSFWSRSGEKGGSLIALLQDRSRTRLKAGWHWAGDTETGTQGLALQMDHECTLFGTPQELRLYYVNRDPGDNTLCLSLCPWPGALRLESGRSALERIGLALRSTFQLYGECCITLQTEWRGVKTQGDLGLSYRESSMRSCLRLVVSPKRKPTP